MPTYIESSLIKNEQVLAEFKHHWWAWVPVWVWVVLGFFPLFIIGWIPALVIFLNLKGTERAVTNKRVIQKTGVISRKTDEMKVGSIETVELQQGILQRIFGAGTVRVTGRGISDVVLKNIDNPAQVKRAIEEAEDWQAEPA